VPIYHHFHFECRGRDGWFVPEDFVAHPDGFDGEPFRSFGQFAFAHPTAGWLDLFYGNDAIFPLQPGAPDDRRGSPLLKYLDQYGDELPDDIRLCWLPYANLMIDCWDEEQLVVGAKVPVPFAILFGDGRQMFPEESLLRAGFDFKSWDRDRVGLRSVPIDRTVGRNRFEISDHPTTHEVGVTWTTSIASYVGWSAEFKRLREFARDEDLRILVTRG